MEKICKECYKNKDIILFPVSYVYKGNKVYSNKCKECSSHYAQNYITKLEGIYAKKKAEAKFRGKDFTLTKEDMAKILDVTHCFYCEQDITTIKEFLEKYSARNSFVNFLNRKKISKRLGFERYDNTIGYTKENTVMACAFCNFMKRTMHGSIYKKIAKENFKIISNSL